MKKILLMTLTGLLAGAIPLLAQFPGGGFPPGGFGGPGMMGGGAGANLDVLLGKTPEERTAEMVVSYKLNETQKQAVQGLNEQYGASNPGSAAMPDIFSMSEEDRQAFFSQMEDRMAEMAERQEQMSNRKESYEDALKQILDKKQFRKYQRERNKAEIQQQREMEQNFRGGFGGGFPGGGGFGGPGGGFGGGGFGGPGGF